MMGLCNYAQRTAMMLSLLILNFTIYSCCEGGLGVTTQAVVRYHFQSYILTFSLLKTRVTIDHVIDSQMYQWATPPPPPRNCVVISLSSTCDILVFRVYVLSPYSLILNRFKLNFDHFQAENEYQCRSLHQHAV